ncbi:MAG: hypothetical protein KGI54_08735 [Pseudomonadota bacterium]|nr:hypothetical protein [Pseudomonadota bacterium]
MKDLIERLRNDTLDDISDTALEAADALEMLTAGDTEMPEPVHHEMDGYVCVGYFSEAQLKDYGDRRAAAAVLAERERCAKVCESIRSNWNYCADAIRKGTP